MGISMKGDPQGISQEREVGDLEQVSLDAGLFEVFDDDDQDGGSFGNIAIDYDSLSFDGSSIEDLLQSGKSEISKSRTVDEKPATATVKLKKKRQSLKIEHAERGLPPPRWHSEAADELHRNAIRMEIAKLLQMRKISPPSESWLRQLPHKVRKLEERLYRSAPSLESYLDRKTLKARLKTLAKAITHQFKEAKMRLSSLHLSRSSIASHSTLASYGNLSTREAIASTRSQDLMSTEKTVIPMPVASTSNSETNNAQSLPLSPNQMSFRQLSAGSSVGDNHNSQRFSCGLSELDRQKAEGFHQQMIGCTWQSEELASCSQQKYLTESCPSKVTLPQNSLAPPLSVGGAGATIGSHKVMGVNFPQNSFGNFVNSTQMMSGQSMPNTNPGVLNQGDMLNGMTLFGQPMNMMMLNSGNNSLLHPTMNAIQMQQGQLQQNQLQYALNSQQMHMFQQSNLDMMRGNPSFGIATQHNSMTPNYYMSNTVDPIMPPPPRIYQGSSTSSSVTESTTILKPSATPHSMGSGKSDTQL